MKIIKVIKSICITVLLAIVVTACGGKTRVHVPQVSAITQKPKRMLVVQYMIQPSAFEKRFKSHMTKCGIETDFLTATEGRGYDQVKENIKPKALDRVKKIGADYALEAFAFERYYTNGRLGIVYYSVGLTELSVSKEVWSSAVSVYPGNSGTEADLADTIVSEMIVSGVLKDCPLPVLSKG